MGMSGGRDRSSKYQALVEHLEKVPQLISRLYEITDELEAMFGRKCAPHDRLVGSIGEAIAVYMYDVVLTESNFKTHDAKTIDGKRLVQIKFAAGSSSFGVYSKPDYLIALRLVNRADIVEDPGEIAWQADIVEVFNGPGEIAWQSVGKRQKNGRYSMGVGKLLKLNASVPVSERIPKVRELSLRCNYM